MAKQRRSAFDFERFLREKAASPECAERFLDGCSSLRSLVRRERRLDLSPCAPADATDLEACLLLLTQERAKTSPVTIGSLARMSPIDIDWSWLGTRLRDLWYQRLFVPGESFKGERTFYDIYVGESPGWPMVDGLETLIHDGVWEKLPGRFAGRPFQDAFFAIRNACYLAAGLALAGRERDAYFFIPLLRKLRWFVPLGMHKRKGFLWLVKGE